ncbi:OLC1v1000725C1 [Oldenlandia corymbosa var. corymbosa]|uniref:phenylalanine--tRNA ligase n=1 Tax=Oldenlandia corymbosa var. corymbosa TaxID=529605 RepID=A0AAV1D5T8_OLDCO|nr:OLC1v1000725C1 [Oldenlandia corymbosa var. corymbosa]
MPTVAVGRDRLNEALGRNYTTEEFEELCFQFGIELDDVTTEKAIKMKEKHLGEEEEAKEGAASGISQALRIFNGIDANIPEYKVSDSIDESSSMLEIHVKKETSQIRPFVVCAVLRGITFDEVKYKSFMDLQDRLHQNICRQRTLVAIGTHDLDTIEGPFTYEALPPQQIKFVPLKQTKEFAANDMMEVYRSDQKLKKFLHIIEDSPVFPVIYDRNRTVLSLPPIINGAHSAITLKTRNVFIECTATDLTRANVVLNTMVTMFSKYCENKFEVEPVRVIYDDDGKSCCYPDLSLYQMEVPLSYITSIVGVELEANEVADLLKKMQLQAELKDNDTFDVSIPPTRSDILHPCDVAEDVAIAYGYDSIPKVIPSCSLSPFVLNEFSHLLTMEIAMAGFSQVENWALCSHEENFTKLNRKGDKRTAVTIENPRTVDSQEMRASLMSGMLKCIGHQKDHPKPIKIFEVGDVVLLDDSKDVGARNQRHCAALYCGANSGFELIHGLVDRIMEVTRKPFKNQEKIDHYIKASDEPQFLSGRQADIIYKGKKIGTFGIVHPAVLKTFDIPDPCSYVEVNLESLL